MDIEEWRIFVGIIIITLIDDSLRKIEL